MSKELVKPEAEDSGFAGEGHVEYPDLYLDSVKFTEVSRYDDTALMSWVDKYHKFLQRDDLMPHHHERGLTNFRRLMFEKAWREGYFDGTD